MDDAINISEPHNFAHEADCMLSLIKADACVEPVILFMKLNTSIYERGEKDGNTT